MQDVQDVETELQFVQQPEKIEKNSEKKKISVIKEAIYKTKLNKKDLNECSKLKTNYLFNPCLRLLARILVFLILSLFITTFLIINDSFMLFCYKLEEAFF